MVKTLIRAVLLLSVFSVVHVSAQQSEADRQLFKETKAQADKGDPAAQLALGNLYFSGTGVSRSLGKGAKWHRKAAEQGLAAAQYQLGLDYGYGEGLKMDKGEAAEWFRKAAEQNMSEAQLQIGLCCLRGNGVTANGEEAVRWFRKAAAQGSVDAEYQLGQCFFDGTGAPKDIEEGVKWIRHAAERGLPAAQCTLAQCYEKGTGVATDPVQAYKWYALAAARDDTRATDIRVSLAKVESQLNKEQVAEAQRLAREFKPVNLPLAEASPEFVVSQGNSAASSGTLQSPALGIVNVNSEDARCEIFVDGAFFGNSPARLRLKEGPHVIEVKRTGFKDYRRQITVTAGSDLNLNVQLESVPPKTP